MQPSDILDNGSHTFMRFPENMTFPSVFAIGPDGGETLVNKTVRDNWLILPSVGRQWRLRSGQAVMCVRNDAFAPSGIDCDARHSETILQELLTFIAEHGAKNVAMTDQIIGCPHEEGIDYPKEQACPKCPYWRNRDRFSHALIH